MHKRLPYYLILSMAVLCIVAVSALPQAGNTQLPKSVSGAVIQSYEPTTTTPIPVLRKESVRDEFVNKNLRETLDCSTSTLVACSQFHENSAFPASLGFDTSRSGPGCSAVPTVGDAFERCPQSGKYFPP